VRIVRFASPSGMSFGVLDGDGQVAQIEGHPFGTISFTGQRFAQADVRLLSPILPSKVVCVGKNYAEHVREMATGDAPEQPLLFLKPSTTVIGPGDAIRIPPGSTNVHHEVELAVVIGARGARHVTPEQALGSVFGYTIANVDGELRQSGRTSQLLFGIPALVSYISQVMTLLPGDVVLTGTPAGVGPIRPGQQVECSIEGLGTLTNSVSGADTTSTAGGAR
jgi:2-keto-4-pentenoate hydratase/2-oxohepta-3-ene-1,7-dioic acid hydratase in catechol pathway